MRFKKTIPQQTRGSKHEGLAGGDGLAGGGGLAGGSTNQAQNVKSSNDRLLFIATHLRTSSEHSVLTKCRLHGESKYPVSSNLLTAL